MLPRTATDFLVVHCSATPASADIGVAEIRRWHRRRGWLDVGYHFVVRRDGTLETGRPVWAAGAHARGVNRRSIGLCLVGGATASLAPENNFTVSQFDTLARLLRDLRRRYPRAEVLGHRDLPRAAKACPSFDVRQWWTSLEEGS